MTTSTVDDRGRVVIPQGLRDATGAQPGTEVKVEALPGGGVAIRPALPMREALARLKASIPTDAPTPKGKRLHPLRVKEMWEPGPRRRTRSG